VFFFCVCVCVGVVFCDGVRFWLYDGRLHSLLRFERELGELRGQDLRESWEDKI
jgi:hypothetical protein